MYLGPAIMYTINLLIMIVVTVTAMFTVSVKLSIFSLLPLPLMGYSIFKVSQLINQKSEHVQNQVSTISTYVQETISGIRVIKSFAREHAVAEKFTEETNEFKKRSLSLAKTDALFQPFILLLIGVSTLLTLLVGAFEVKAGRISLGNIAEFILYINMLTWPVASVGWVTSLVQKAAASQKRINEFLKTVPDIDKSAGHALMSMQGEIEFKNVSFTYKDSGIEALKNISFKVNAGHSIGIIGKTGSGKSTLANLLMRLYDPDNGTVYIDGKDIRTVNTRELRDHIAYVPQDVFLFSDSIRNNIAFGVNADHIKEEQIISASKKAVIYENIMEFPKQFETMVGERGITLSGGQKQRISIARAIAKDPEILIFDDCLSAVDTATEDQILKNLKEEIKGRTSVIISHRVSSVMQADRIVVIEDGMITENGTHQEQLDRKGFYYNLYHSQLTSKA
jgi:ATP-binding cassette, subfamily B, multidrug efflux pump